MKRAYRYLVFKINDAQNGIEVEHAGPRDASFETFKSHMPENEPRYAVYELEFTKSDGRQEFKLLFINYSPDNCTQGAVRFVYSTHKETVKNKCSPVHKGLQVNDHADIKESDWIAEFQWAHQQFHLNTVTQAEPTRHSDPLFILAMRWPHHARECPAAINTPFDGLRNSD